MHDSEPIYSGQEEPIEALLGRLRPRLNRILYRFRIPEQDAEDLVQDCVLSLVRRRPECPEAWLLAGLRYRCLMYWRSRRRRLYQLVDDTLLDHLAEPEPSTDRRVDIGYDLKRLLPQIPSRCRSLLKLRYQFGLNTNEVAEELGYRSSSIGTITKRCLSVLTQKLVGGGYCKEPSS